MDIQQNGKEVPNVNSENIKDEFYKWFESKGLLSDLRTYMRQLMVKALEQSNTNGKICLHKKGSSSPKLQAINLLVVDYLFHEDYLYTVSVFASEAQILESLPQYSCYITQTVKDRHWDPSSLPRFSAQETEDILDTLRLPPSQQDVKRALQMYLSGQESLLTCIVRTMATSNNQGVQCFRPDNLNNEMRPEDDEFVCSYKLWSKEIQDLLLLAGVKLHHIKRMQHKWTQIIEEEKCKTKKEVEAELKVVQEEFRQRTEERIRYELRQEIENEQQELIEQRNEVETKEQGLTSLAEQLTAAHEDISERLSQLQLKNEELKEKEAIQESTRLQLEDRMSKIKLREEYLENEISRFQEQRVENAAKDENEEKLKNPDSCEHHTETKILTVETAVQVDLHQSVASTSTQIDVGITAFTQTLNTEDHEQQTSLSSQPDPELLLQQLQMERQKINELQEENLELRARVLQQRTRIDELTNRAASLSTQLGESQVAVAVLSGRESGVVMAQPSPPPYQAPSPFIAPTFGFNTPQRAGAGEESLFVPRPQQTPSRPDGRRRPLRFAFSQNPSPPSEESSPTDEVIQNARLRIRQLEEESAAIQQNYQQFQSRLLTTDSVMFPPLNSPRIHHNPVFRVRRNNVVPGFSIQGSTYPYPTTSLDVYAPRTNLRQFQHVTNEDSSSEQSSLFYETARIEDMTHSRRMFSQRNMRQFDRWKQFKKKFQRRNNKDLHRRDYHTSSDDEEIVKINSKRMDKSNKPKKISDNNDENIKASNAQHSDDIKHCGTHQPESKNSEVLDSKLENPTVSDPSKTSENVLKEEIISCGTRVSMKDFKLKEQESLKLIESVITLLNESNHMSENLNSSLTTESMPEDNLNNVNNTSTNVIVVDHQTDHDFPKGNSSPKDKISSNLSKDNFTVVPSVMKDEIENILSQSISVPVSEHEDALQPQDENTNERSNIVEAPGVPTLRLTSQDLNKSDKDFPEHEIEEKETTSVSSGSDILQELNPTKSNSSESVLSTGFADGSKHSSDFWN